MTCEEFKACVHPEPYLILWDPVRLREWVNHMGFCDECEAWERNHNKTCDACRKRAEEIYQYAKGLWEIKHGQSHG